MNGELPAWLSMALAVAGIAAIVALFRAFLRRPSGVTSCDPPGTRTVVAFHGDDPSFQADDDPQGPYVGLRLFRTLCDDLAAQRIGIENRGTLQNAQRAECVLGSYRYALVLEWLEEAWLLSVDWTPRTAAERRHLAWTHEVYAPQDSPELRQLLSTLDGWLKAQPSISHVRWYRKEAWIASDTGDPRPVPIET